MSEPTDYQKFDFGRDINFSISEAIRKAPADADTAAELLLLTAKLLRSGRSLPANLVDYLAGAFEASMRKPEKRAEALGRELNLTNLNKRPSRFDWLDALKLVEANSSKSNAEIKVLIMKASGHGETFATTVLKAAVKAKAEYDTLVRLERNNDSPPRLNPHKAALLCEVELLSNASFATTA